MKQIITEFCEQNKQGLLLLDMPTGSGKTYHAIQYLYEASLKPENKGQKFFFVTPLKKNLPYNELKAVFEENGQLEMFNEKVLFLKPIAETVMTAFTAELEQTIPEQIKQNIHCRNLVCEVQKLHRYQRESFGKQGQFAIFAEAIKTIEDKISKEYEPKFRNVIVTQLKTTFKTAKQRLRAIKHDKAWQWVGELYPAVFTSEKQILLMSMDKFLYKNQTLIESPYYFYEKMAGAVMIIDEFDATKRVVLDQLIEQQLKYQGLDILELFKTINAMLEKHQLANDFLTPSQQRLQSNYHDKPLLALLAELQTQASYLFERHNLQFHYRTRELATDATNFLFHDYKTFTVFQEQDKQIRLTRSMENQLNYLDFIDAKQPGNNKIYYLLEDLQYFLRLFARNIDILATNYLQAEREKQRVSHEVTSEITFENALSTLLKAFHLPQNYIDYLIYVITSKNYRKTKENQGKIVIADDFDLSFYQTGFRYFNFIDDLNHDMQTQIDMVDFQTTPEKLLLTCARKLKVIGISATATLETVLGNYDLAYLQNQLAADFHLPTPQDRERLKADFTRATAAYHQVTIETALISGKTATNDWQTTWTEILDDRELAQLCLNRIQQSGAEDHDVERYVRIAKAYQYFLRQPELYSFLCLLTKMPREQDVKLDVDQLAQIFELLTLAEQQRNANYQSACDVVYLESQGYDQQKAELLERLAQGEKLFVISTYAAIGAGQNLQYPIPKQLAAEIVKINDFPTIKNEKDFDGIYLDKPTHLLVSQLSEFENSYQHNLHLGLFQVEYLHQRAEISRQQTREMIRNVLQNNKHILARGMSQDQLPSVKALAMRVLIQAVGRLCRTNQKSKKIHILIDERVNVLFDEVQVTNRLLNPEFHHLVTLFANSNQQREAKVTTILQAGNNQSMQVNSWIQNHLRLPWTSQNMAQWEALRIQVLKQPTLSAQEWQQSTFKNFYIELPVDNDHIFFEQRHDYADIELMLEKTQTAQAVSAQAVSAQAARLSDIIGIPGVAAYFQEHGYATDFGKQRYILAPPVFNNIYKGALGEVVGKFLLEQMLNVNLAPIQKAELFELFDFQIANQPIYVDFKHWSQTTDMDETKMYTKITNKLLTCHGELALIINIFGDSRKQIRQKVLHDQQVKIVTIPGLYDQVTKQFNQQAFQQLLEVIHEHATTTTTK